MSRGRLLELGVRVAAAVAALGLVLTLVSSGPYLSFSDPNPFVWVYAAGLFGLLLAAPFAIHARVAARERDRDRRWEVAVMSWGGGALAVAVVLGGLLVGTGLDSGDSLGAIATVSMIECGLVVAAVAVLVLGGG